jgi:predicted transcriptional regulator
MGAEKSLRSLLQDNKPVVKVRTSSTVADLARLLEARRVGSAVVIDEGNHIAGIVSERDVVRKVVARNVDPTETTVAEIMSTRLVTCPASASLEEAQKLMAFHGIRHLPVVEQGRIAGVISIRDVLTDQLNKFKDIVSVQSELINSLEQNYPGISQIKKDTSGRVVI